MKRIIFFIILLNWTLASFAAAQEWQSLNSQVFYGAIIDVQFFPADNTRVLLASEHAVYLSDNQGKSFQLIKNFGNTISLRKILIRDKKVFILTADELLELDLFWRFTKSVSKLSMIGVEFKDFIYTGNEWLAVGRNSIWQANGQLHSWIPLVRLSGGQFNHIRKFKENFLVATDSKVYVFDFSGRQLREVFSSATISVVEDESDLYFEESDSNETLPLIRDLLMVGDNWYVLTAQGLFHSTDQGTSWTSLSNIGMTFTEAISVATFLDPSSLTVNNLKLEIIIVGSIKGVFVYAQKQWLPVFQGLLNSENGFYLRKNNTQKILTFDEDHLYQLNCMAEDWVKLSEPLKVGLSEEEVGHLTDLFSDEPHVQDVHKMAIDYAQVSNKKIQTWRDSAKKRGILPNFSVSFDTDHNRTISDSIWGSYTGGGQYYKGPNDYTRYKNLGFGVSMSWDLGDLIWNGEELSIDSRAKMMVELRQEILDQVTRVYFERRRLQIDLVRLSSLIPEEKLQQQLRIDELTALLDALTGGKFCETLEIKTN